MSKNILLRLIFRWNRAEGKQVLKLGTLLDVTNGINVTTNIILRK